MRRIHHLIVGAIAGSLAWAGIGSAHAAPTPAATPVVTPSATPSATPSPTVTPATPPATPRRATPSASSSPPAPARAAATASRIQTKYASLGGAASNLGKPLGGEENLGAAVRQRYEHGAIYDHAGGTFFIDGAIFLHYAELNVHGGKLGLPQSDPFFAGRGVVVQRFAHGNIYWRGDVGATHVMGANLAKYGEHGWENGFMDAPSAGEFRGNDGESWLNWFVGGATILWHPASGSHEVHGAIRERWHGLGGEGGFGRPVTDEFPGNDGGRARLNFFDGRVGPSSIVWTPQTGAHEVHGAIREAWHGEGAEGGELGAPTTDEFTPARPEFRVSVFERGLIVFSPQYGAQVVKGALLAEYARRGWENGDLGAPTSHEWRFADGWAQDFEQGRLLFFDNGSYRTQVRANPFVRPAGPGDVVHTFRPGCPVGPDQLRVVDLNHLGYDGRIHRGQLVLRHDAVDRTIRAFSGAAWDSFPIHHMVNIDVYGGDDPRSMEANNTSAFNCRPVVGNPYRMSPHAYGRAVDINTVQNPYFDGSRWWPANGTPWIDRNRRDPGMLFHGGLMTRNMTDNGYFWGGWWAAKDYHHFEIQ